MSVINLSEKHPSFNEHLPDWILMRDAYKGERQIKSKGTLYLPATSGQIQDGMDNPNQPGWKAYNAYVTRARFPGFVRENVQTAIGMMHSMPPKISLPRGLKNIVSTKGESLPHFLRRINEEQLILGRVGIFADLPSVSKDGIPFLSIYTAERIINWDDGTLQGLIPQKLNFVVLDESDNERNANSFGWVNKEKYRLLCLGDPTKPDQLGVYKFGVFSEKSPSILDSSLVAAQIRGVTLTEIPFVIVNSSDLVAEADDPPFLDLGNLSVSIYRGEADYRQNLFMQGQDTLVIIGGSADVDEQIRTGSGARIDVNNGGDAKYIGVESDGLSEQREALENDRARAGSMGAQATDTVSRERESGTSLNTRIAARTANLNQIAITGAAGLERILKICAVWSGENPEEVRVEPNLEFGDHVLSGQSMVEMATARNAGFPISARSLHQIAFDRGITKLTFEQEEALAKTESKGPFAKAMTEDRAPEQVGGNGPPKK